MPNPNRITSCMIEDLESGQAVYVDIDNRKVFGKVHLHSEAINLWAGADMSSQLEPLEHGFVWVMLDSENYNKYKVPLRVDCIKFKVYKATPAEVILFAKGTINGQA